LKTKIVISAALVVLSIGVISWKSKLDPVYSAELAVGHDVCKVLPENATTDHLCFGVQTAWFRQRHASLLALVIFDPSTQNRAEYLAEQKEVLDYAEHYAETQSATKH
jgi:hypothetical protein